MEQNTPEEQPRRSAITIFFKVFVSSALLFLFLYCVNILENGAPAFFRRSDSSRQRMELADYQDGFDAGRPAGYKAGQQYQSPGSNQAFIRSTAQEWNKSVETIYQAKSSEWRRGCKEGYRKGYEEGGGR